MNPLAQYSLQLIWGIGIFYFGTSQPWNTLLITIILALWGSWIALQQDLSIPKRLYIPLMIFIIWALVLLIPIPIEWHQWLMPKYAAIRNPILQHLDIASYPLAIHPQNHLGSVLFGLALIPILPFFAQWPRKTEQYHWLKDPISHLLMMGVAFCLVGWLQVFTKASSIYWISNIPETIREPFFASFINPNHSGYFIMMLLPFALIRFPRKWSLLCIGLFGISIFQTHSRGAIGCMGLILIFWALQRVKLQLFWFVLAGIGSLFTIREFWLWQSEWSLAKLTALRTELWWDSIQLWKDSWLFGTGFGGFEMVYPLVKSNPNYSITFHAHQELIEWWLTTGLFGILIFTYLIKNHQWQLKANQPINWAIRMSFGGLLLASLVDFPLHLGAILILFAMLYALQLGQTASLQWVSIDKKAIMAFWLLLFFQVIQWQNPNSPYAFTKSGPNQNSIQVRSNLIAKPMNTLTLQNYIWQQDPIERIPLMEILIASNPTNVQSWILSARTHHQLQQFDQSCHAWYEALQLEFPIVSEKLDYVGEALGCSSNLWEAMFALPDDASILVQAGQILQKQQALQSADFLFERAAQLDQFGQKHYTRFLIQQQSFKKALTYHRWETTPTCIDLKNMADLGFAFHIQETELWYQQLQNQCGQNPYWKHRQLLAALKNANPNAIQSGILYLEQKTDSYFAQFLTHALVLNQNFEQACAIIGNEEYHDLFNDQQHQECEHRHSISGFPLWQMLSLKEFELTDTHRQ